LERRQASLAADIRKIDRYDGISAFNWHDLLVEGVSFGGLKSVSGMLVLEDRKL
jgi:hypothetical protein